MGAKLDLEQVRTLVEHGVPFSQIADRFGVTPSVIKGHVFRRGWGRGEEGRIEALKAWHQSNRLKVRLFVRPETQVTPTVAAVLWPVTLTSAGLCELQPGQCHWPVGEATGHLQAFCGGATAGHQGYCAEHLIVSREAPAEAQPHGRGSSEAQGCEKALPGGPVQAR